MRCDHCFSILDEGTVETYGPEYYAETHRNWFAHPNVALFEAIHRVASEVSDRASVLDVGCGKGDLLKYLLARNPRYSLHGVDLSENPSVPGIAIERGDFLRHEFGRRFDVVVSLATIEHVEDIHGFVRRLRELCSPGGAIVVMTLNDRSVLYGVSRMLGRIGWKVALRRIYDPHHLHHFTVRSLATLMREEQLGVERTIRHNAPVAAMDYPSRSALGRAVMRMGVWGTFVLGKATGRTYLQTVVARRPRSSDAKHATH